MNVPNDELDTMAETALAVNKHALDALSAIRSGDTTAALNAVSEVQHRNWNLRKRLLANGAQNSITESARNVEAVFAEMNGGSPSESHSTHALNLLSSRAAERYVAALRECANACREMEIERGQNPSDGMTEYHELAADAAELEVFGPKELR